ncbi:MAG: hypothetical protein IID40_04140 [Planctomycetes bacterium]|nr:hypothetical protein [Planctomycetota bacterium]
MVADVGGTVELPPVGCDYLSPEEVHEIIDNLPAGVTIELAAIHKDIACGTNGTPQFPWCPPAGLCEDPADGNGSLGGRRDCFDSTLELSIDFKNNGIPFHHRDITIGPVTCAVHTAPRTVGDAVQDFDTVMFDLQGQLGGGDPDFASLVITAGNNNGLPSPGHTTLTQLPGGQFAVDSFFDITYRIDWVGTAAGVLNGASGSTTAIVRMRTGTIPDCDGSCPVGTICEKTVVVLADGTIDVCCDCIAAPPQCQPLPDGSACEPFTCSDGVSLCSPSCSTVDPLTGVVTVTACDCRPPDECQVDAGTSPGPRVETRGGGDPCVVPPGPPGTITLPPPGCDYLSPEEVHVILDGLPAGATIELAPIHKSFICKQGPAGGFPGCPPPGICEEPGGSLGGQVDCFQSVLEMTVTGTGPLAGFNRILSIPTECQVHTGPRTPGDAIQEFDTDMFFLQGELPPGDPDFCVLKITGGTGFGMPSPGQTTLTELPGGSYAVDSFFNITYQIEYVGCANGALAGLSGTTIAKLEMVTGTTPSCVGGCPAGEECEEIQTVNADGTITVCCNCIPAPTCDPNPDGLGCQPFVCPDPAVEDCQAICVHFDAATGQTVVTDCECRNIGDCHVEMVPIGAGGGRGTPGTGGCVVPDTSGGGTINLPPDGCDYLSPDEFHLIVPDSVPAGTTIEVDASHHGFLCCDVTCPPPAPPPDLCRDNPGRGGSILCNDDCTSEVLPGGNLGGEIERFDSILTLNMNGTGDLAGFSTSIDIAVACEVHTALRTPGDPVQSFPTEMVQMVGALDPGDADLCSLTIIAGSNFGLPPSTGQTTLALLPSGDYNVDSFFDMEYQIDFVGCPGGALGGLTGSTTGTLRMETGSGATEIPKCVGNCPAGTQCVESVTTFSDGSFDMCCNCVTVPVLTAVSSCAVHDPNGIQAGPERKCMSIVAPSPRGACDPRNDTTIEPRFYGIGGATSPDFNEIDFVLNGPAAGAVTVSASCTDGSTPSASPVTVSTDGLTVTAIFDPALPNTHCCTLTLGGGATGSQVIKMLRGDVNGSTRVNATDKNIVKLKASTQTPPLVCDDFFYDVDMSGRINATDKNLVKARITTTPALDALCP